MPAMWCWPHELGQPETLMTRLSAAATALAALALPPVPDALELYRAMRAV